MTTFIRRTFSGGELDPALRHRVDFSKYQTGLATMRNCYVPKEGGAVNRHGSTYVGGVSDSSKRARLIPFILNNNESFVIEFSETLIRFIQNGEYIRLPASSITAVSYDPEIILTSASHGLTTGDRIFISEALGLENIVSNYFNVTVIDGDTFKISSETGGSNLDTTVTGGAALATNGSFERVYSISSPYLESELKDIRFSQQADTIRLVHPNHAPRALRRFASTNWTLNTIDFTVDSDILTITTLFNGTGGESAGTTERYKITTVFKRDGIDIESLPSFEETTGFSSTPGTSDFLRLTWTVPFTLVPVHRQYNVYKATSSGVFGFIGTSFDATFDDNGIEPDITKRPPENRNIFAAAGDYPSAIVDFQQRQIFANSNANPERIWVSGLNSAFEQFVPSTDDDISFVFDLNGRFVSEVAHMLDIGRLLIFTSTAEWVALGNENNSITPTQINLTQQSEYGSSFLRPLVVGNSALFVQARGQIVRDIGYSINIDGYGGNDMTVFSSHLFKNKTICDWSYQRSPESIVWVAMSDGGMLGLTLLREQQVLAWHRHDFKGGEVESVCVVPEASEDILYVVVKRTIDGRTSRYVERIKERCQEDVRDYAFMDSHATFDGRNTTTNRITITGGTTWAYDETLTLSATDAGGSPAPVFFSSDIGNQYQIGDIRFTVEGFGANNLVTGKASKTVPVELRDTPTTSWARAVDNVFGLRHLEGQQVAVFGDGFVDHSPNNDDYEIVTVTNGSINLAQPRAVIHVGIPYVTDVETLDIDTIDGETLVDKQKMIHEVNVAVSDTRGLWAGEAAPESDSSKGNLLHYKPRECEDNSSPNRLRNDLMDLIINSSWTSTGKVFIRQIDPLPMNILAIAPAGDFPFRTSTRR